MTYTATVAVTSPGTGTPSSSDTVTFKDGASTISCGSGSQAFDGTTATCVVTYASAGSHSVTAVFGGDANYGGSTSSALSETVNAAVSTSTLLQSTTPGSITTTSGNTELILVYASGATNATSATVSTGNGTPFSSQSGAIATENIVSTGATRTTLLLVQATGNGRNRSFTVMLSNGLTLRHVDVLELANGVTVQGTPSVNSGQLVHGQLYAVLAGHLRGRLPGHQRRHQQPHHGDSALGDDDSGQLPVLQRDPGLRR